MIVINNLTELKEKISDLMSELDWTKKQSKFFIVNRRKKVTVSLQVFILSDEL